MRKKKTVLSGDRPGGGKEGRIRTISRGADEQPVRTRPALRLPSPWAHRDEGFRRLHDRWCGTARGSGSENEKGSRDESLDFRPCCLCRRGQPNAKQSSVE